MQAPAAGDVAAAPPALAPASVAPAAPDSHSVGDRILQGMQGVSTEMRSAWTKVSDMLSPGHPMLSMQEMLGLQLHLTQASMQFELVGKGISRSTQNFDQLVRVQ
ncbi:EscI/YscI/HrpB family type III secretion system inner rod protein [Comamonas endophytica]